MVDGHLIVHRPLIASFSKEFLSIKGAAFKSCFISILKNKLTSERSKKEEGKNTAFSSFDRAMNNDGESGNELRRRLTRQ
jgi:hypothetical protein